MNTLKRVSRVFKAADEIPFDDSSRIVLMSDCHRGNGSWADDFGKNQNLYFAALKHYYKENYTYIELGDGDELWKFKKLSDIVSIHSHVFWLLSKFYKEGRLHIIYGNHDMVKRYDKFVKDNMYEYFDEKERKHIPLFPKIKIHEGLILKHKATGHRIFLIHGHQGDVINDQMWRLGRLLVRYLWGTLSGFGIDDPTSAAKNYDKKDEVENRLAEWVQKENQMLIAGHTHRPVFPEAGDIPYFNDGSSVHPRCITAIEIESGNITLVKWNVQTKEDGTLFIGREVLAGPRKLKDYLK
jgi:UDP-2,3-diacylglucosamine pyrophosphatase LpxH